MRQLPHLISGECDDSISASAPQATFAEETSEIELSGDSANRTCAARLLRSAFVLACCLSLC